MGGRYHFASVVGW